MSPGKPKGRRPGDSDTKETILVAARELFAEVGYERASMRAVAARADVDPALIHHYFGTKDGLLAAALVMPVDPAVILVGAGADPDHVGEEIVRRLVSVMEANPAARIQMIGILRTALSHEDAAAAMRNLLIHSVLPVLEGMVNDDTAPLRAALIGSQLGGLMLARYVLAIPPIVDLSPVELAEAVGPALQHYVSGALSVSSARNRSRQ